MLKQGIEFVKPTPEDMIKWRNIVARAIREMGEKGAYSHELYNRIQRHLDEFRSGRR